MRFAPTTVRVFLAAASAVVLTGSTTSAFTPSPAFIGSPATSAKLATSSITHRAGCTCPACTGVHKPGCICPSCMSATHPASCSCPACARVQTRLFADATETDAATETEAAAAPAEEEEENVVEAVMEVASAEETEREETPAAAIMAEAAEDDIPAEVEAMDGIDSQDEAHNAERNYRGSLKKHKKGPKGTPLSELEVGSSVSGKVKKIASYGAFVDIGAASDGLLHISRLANEFVQDVNDVLKEGESIEVRIAAVDTTKNQISLSMMSEEEEAAAKEAQRQPRQQRRGGGGGGGRRDYSAVLGQLQEKGWDTDKFVEGEVERTLDFGAFVKIDASQLNPEVEGNMDGLVHISALTVGRANSVTDIVNPGDKVQVRVKGIADGKVSLSMINKEDEQQRGPRRGGGEPVFEGAKDWKESLEKIQGELPTFKNSPVVIDLRK